MASTRIRGMILAARRLDMASRAPRRILLADRRAAAAHGDARMPADASAMI